MLGTATSCSRHAACSWQCVPIFSISSTSYFQIRGTMAMNANVVRTHVPRLPPVEIFRREGLSLTTVCSEDSETETYPHFSRSSQRSGHPTASWLCPIHTESPAPPMSDGKPPPNLVFQTAQYSPQGSITRCNAQASLDFLEVISVLGSKSDGPKNLWTAAYR